MASGLVVHAAGGTVVECNAAAERMLGLSRQQILGSGPVDRRWGVAATRPDRTTHSTG